MRKFPRTFLFREQRHPSVKLPYFRQTWNEDHVRYLSHVIDTADSDFTVPSFRQYLREVNVRSHYVRKRVLPVCKRPSGVTIILGPRQTFATNVKVSRQGWWFCEIPVHSLITVLIHNSGHFGPPLPFWAPAPPALPVLSMASYATERAL